MPEKYELLRTADGQAWVKSSRVDNLRDVDAIVFDCDGVLIDAGKSYDATMIKVADRLVQELLGTKLPWREFGPSLILQLRRTGLFNNDWDTTYALIMFSALALSEGHASVRANEATARIRRIVNAFCASVKGVAPAHETVKRYLQSAIANSSQDSTLSRVRERLGYPGSPPRSFMATVFDEIYHGSRLYRQMYGTAARYYSGEGLIERERILVGRRDLNSLNAVLGKGKLAIVTGRPFLPAKHVLKSMLAYFNRKASMFLGDMDVHPELAAELSSFRKPSGQGLVHASKTFSSNMLLCVGDSAEDIMMVENARAEIPVLSCGVYGTRTDEAEQARFFRNRDVDLVLPTARLLPTVLRLFRK